MGNKKTVELKAKVDKISDNHLKDLQSIVNTVNQLQFNIGKIEAQKHTALHDLAVANDKIGEFQNDLVKEYGTYDVNLMTGKINWPEDEK